MCVVLLCLFVLCIHGLLKMCPMVGIDVSCCLCVFVCCDCFLLCCVVVLCLYCVVI